MSLSTFVLLCLVCLVAWYIYQYKKTSAVLEDKAQELQTLNQKYEALQKTLLKRGRRLDVLLSSVSEVVLRVDKQGRVLGGNTQAEMLFGFTRVSELPQSMLLFYRDSEWIKAFQNAVSNLPEQKQLPEMKIKGRVLLPRLAALSESEALLLCMDVTAYTQLQNKQQNLLENLMHDLKTPLTSLLGYARSIEAFDNDKALRHEAATVIAQEAKHINDLMNSMLALNQIDLEVEQGEQCDLNLVLERVKQSLDFALKQEDMHFQLETHPASAVVKLSETDCYRVLMNVVENALKFSPKGSTIRCFVEEEDKYFAISIIDQGHGIPKKFLSRVTERFYRVDKVRGREKAEGHGLGLAIVQEILDRDGGVLHMENTEQGGLCVQLMLPK